MITIEEFRKKYSRLPTELDADYHKELKMSLATSKIQVLDHPKLAPGQCVVCGSRGGDSRKFVDIGFDTEEPTGPFSLKGAMYWCTVCVDQVVRELAERGIIELPVKKVPFEVKVERVVEVPVLKESDMQGITDRLEEILDRIGEIHGSADNSGSVEHNTSGSTTSATVLTRSEDEDSSEPDNGTTEDESGLDEQDSSGQSAIVHGIEEYIRSGKRPEIHS